MLEGCADRAGMATHTLDGQVLVGTVLEAGRPRWGYGGWESATWQGQEEKCVSCACPRRHPPTRLARRPMLFSLVKEQEPCWPRSPAREQRCWTQPRCWLLSAR